MLAVIMSSALVVLLATSYSYNKLPDSVLMVVVVPGLVYRALVDGQIFDVVFTTTITCLLAFAFAEAYKKSQGKKLKNFSHLKFFAVAGVWVSLPEFLYFLPMVIFFTFLSAILADKYERKPAPYLTASIAIPILYAVLR